MVKVGDSLWLLGDVHRPSERRWEEYFIVGETNRSFIVARHREWKDDARFQSKVLKRSLLLFGVSGSFHTAAGKDQRDWWLENHRVIYNRVERLTFPTDLAKLKAIHAALEAP